MAKRKNPMGYIYPKKIQETIHSVVDKKVQIGYEKYEARRQEGEQWVDDHGKMWEKKNGVIQSIPRFQEARVPLFCPKCKSIMGKRSKDVEVYYKFGFCLDCLLERDFKMMREGTWDEYQKNYIHSKQLGYYKETKLEIKEYLKTLDKGYIEYINSDGKVEKWSGADIDKIKDFWLEELEMIDKELKLLEKENEKISTTTNN